MTRDEIIATAREAQMPFYWRTGEITYLDKLERFAALVAEQTLTTQKARYYQDGYEAGKRDEREACAKVCDELQQEWRPAGECADAIRERSNT